MSSFAACGRRSELQVLREILQIPGAPEELDRVGIDLASRRSRVGRRILRRLDDEPQVALGRRERHGVPVDEEALRARAHDVSRVRLAVRDHVRAAARGNSDGETVDRREKLAHVFLAGCERRASGFRERPAGPGDMQVPERSIEMLAPGKREPHVVGDRGDRGRRTVEVGEQLHERAALAGRLVAPELARASIDEREERDRVARPDPAHGRAVTGREWRDDELEALVAQGERGVERALEPLEDGIACVAEPRLLIEIVDRGETARAAAVANEPVIAACAERRVVGRLDVEVPALGQEARDRVGVEIVGQRLQLDHTPVEAGLAVGSDAVPRCARRRDDDLHELRPSVVRACAVVEREARRKALADEPLVHRPS